MARDSHESMSFEQQNDCPSISEQVACKKLLITSCAPVPVPVFSYKALTFEKSRIPPHTLAHKHDTRKDISVLCNERGKLETYDILDGHEKFTSNHGSQKVGIWTQKTATKFETFSSYKSSTVRTVSQSLITPYSRVLPGKLTGSLQINPGHASQSHYLKAHFNNVIPFMTRSSKWFFSSDLSTKPCMQISFLPCVPYAQPISIFIRLLNIW